MLLTLFWELQCLLPRSQKSKGSFYGPKKFLVLLSDQRKEKKALPFMLHFLYALFMEKQIILTMRENHFHLICHHYFLAWYPPQTVFRTCHKWDYWRNLFRFYQNHHHSGKNPMCNLHTHFDLRNQTHSSSVDYHFQLRSSLITHNFLEKSTYYWKYENNCFFHLM